MSLGHLLDAAANVWRVPDVEGEHCVHSRLETASCRRCVDACPRAAWVLNDDMLGIDVNACDGCGLCIPACPEGAILSDYLPEIRRHGAEQVAFAACELAAVPGTGGRLPCLHSLGVADVTRLYRRGISRVFVCHADCGECPRGSGATLSDAVDTVNELLDARGAGRMMLVALVAEQWKVLRERSDDDAEPAMSRRAFLGRATARAVEQAAQRVVHDAVADAPAAWVPPGRLIPRAGSEIGRAHV